jgi:hypothetical protein
MYGGVACAVAFKQQQIMDTASPLQPHTNPNKERGSLNVSGGCSGGETARTLTRFFSSVNKGEHKTVNIGDNGSTIVGVPRNNHNGSKAADSTIGC